MAHGGQALDFTSTKFSSFQSCSPGVPQLKAVPATIEAFGGKFIVRGGDLKFLEGEWPHRRLVIIEFPSREAAERWYRSPEYQKIIGLRLNSTVGNLVIVEGQG